MVWVIQKASYRVVQAVLKVASYFLDWREPSLLKGAGSIKKLPDEIKKLNITSVLIVTDKVIEGLHLMDSLLERLKHPWHQVCGIQRRPAQSFHRKY